MNETTDLEQIAALEHRITTALDRIARGVAARTAAPAPTATADTSELEERLAALSAALEETQAALQSEQNANADLNERLRAVESARQADADQANRDIAELQAQLNSAPEPAAEPDGPDREELEAELARQREVESVLRRRIARLREERKTVRAEFNEVRDQLEEVEGKLDQLQALTDASAPSASGELARLRDSNRALRDTIEELREAIAAEGPPDDDLVTSALAAELESLKADRAAEAAEARAILSEIRPVLQGGAADA
jgi:chromosome segregation ATPase